MMIFISYVFSNIILQSNLHGVIPACGGHLHLCHHVPPSRNPTTVTGTGFLVSGTKQVIIPTLVAIMPTLASYDACTATEACRRPLNAVPLQGTVPRRCYGCGRRETTREGAHRLLALGTALLPSPRVTSLLGPVSAPCWG